MVSISKLEAQLKKLSEETGLFSISSVYKQGRDVYSKPSYVEIETTKGWFEILANGYGATNKRQIGGKWSEIKKQLLEKLY